MPCIGQNGFGVYLGAFDHVLYVSQSHYFPFLGPGGYLQAGGKRRGFDDQRMVAGLGSLDRIPLNSNNSGDC